jgi:hypothetical protein
VTCYCCTCTKLALNRAYSDGQLHLRMVARDWSISAYWRARLLYTSYVIHARCMCAAANGWLPFGKSWPVTCVCAIISLVRSNRDLSPEWLLRAPSQGYCLHISCGCHWLGLGAHRWRPQEVIEPRALPRQAPFPVSYRYVDGTEPASCAIQMPAHLPRSFMRSCSVCKVRFHRVRRCALWFALKCRRYARSGADFSP